MFPSCLAVVTDASARFDKESALRWPCGLSRKLELLRYHKRLLSLLLDRAGPFLMDYFIGTVPLCNAAIGVLLSPQQ